MSSICRRAVEVVCKYIRVCNVVIQQNSCNVYARVNISQPVTPGIKTVHLKQNHTGIVVLDPPRHVSDGRIFEE